MAIVPYFACNFALSIAGFYEQAYECQLFCPFWEEVLKYSHLVLDFERCVRSIELVQEVAQRGVAGSFSYRISTFTRVPFTRHFRKSKHEGPNIDPSLHPARVPLSPPVRYLHNEVSLPSPF
jgi:hypothetical protein